jgi:hypothetical protein
MKQTLRSLLALTISCLAIATANSRSSNGLKEPSGILNVPLTNYLKLDNLPNSRQLLAQPLYWPVTVPVSVQPAETKLHVLCVIKLHQEPEKRVKALLWKLLIKVHTQPGKGGLTVVFETSPPGAGSEVFVSCHTY